ncbi:Ig-like domain-containing protein [Cloacibacillus porcorum]|uniref:Ig-like domain-containing protein n=1 Tax=Cloacibacillus porcorum TaxID=1197717 RepID=UPI0023F3305A|nr:Ig-like domain-containing protein [Cloacibacillus porcorum]MCC8183237.1 Ig-like domain-containing protein [Cloacibacillus porcorum]
MTLFILAAPGTARADLKRDDDGCYIIATSEDLREFNRRIHTSKIPLSADARLTADIDLTQADGTPTVWEPIGGYSERYTGTFDGAGHTVKGYRINKADEMGFFGTVGGGGTVRGLTVSGDINITDKGNPTYAGGVAANCLSGGTIEGCVNAASLTSSADDVRMGGIVGHCIGGTISNCVNSGDIANTSDNMGTGGIAGKNESSGTISNCLNSGNVSNNLRGHTGGIVGHNYGDGSRISNCLSSGGKIKGGNPIVTGGVAGVNENKGTVSNCGWLGSSADNGVGSGMGTVTNVKSLSPDNVNESIVALSADITEQALNNGDTARISLSTIYGNKKDFSTYVTSIDVTVSSPDILSADISGDIVILTARAKGVTKRTVATVTLLPDLHPTDFDTMKPSNSPSDPPLKFTFGVTVSPRVSGVTIYGDVVSPIYKDGTRQLGAIVKPNDAGNKNVSWKSSRDDVAIVNENGLVTAIAVGSADITVTTEDTDDDGRQCTDTCTVTVIPVNVTSVDISPKTLSIDMNDEGRTYKLTATVLPDNAEYDQVRWTSSNEKVAVVSPDKSDAKALTAYVTPISKGETYITASVGDLTSVHCFVTVIPVWAESVTVSPDIFTLEAGRSAKLSALVGPEKATDKSVSWKSGDKNIATVSENGEVFAHTPGGPVLITATASGAKDDANVRASCSLTVTAPPVPVESVEISPEGAAIKVGESLQFTAKILPENADNKGVTWKSGDEKVATVDANGKVTAVAVGSTAITVTTIDGLKTAEATVSVNKVYSSGSGCAAGVGALALFTLLPLWMRRKKR